MNFTVTYRAKDGALREERVDAANRAECVAVCQEGWAPPPTNEYQRAIWNDVHKIPEKPMKIDFDPAKGK